MNASPNHVPPRRLVYVLLITVAAAGMGARILAVTRLYEPHLSRPPDNYQGPREPWQGPEGSEDPRGRWPAIRPAPIATLGANDRSRWATIRALVDEGTYAIGRRDPALATPTNRYGDAGIISEDGWGTIDKVMLDDKFYSSKPPFLPTLLAGEYWLLKQVFGWSITDPRGLVVRTILFTVNWLPFVVFLVLLARLIDRLGGTDWARLYVLATGCFATYLTTFAITLNNHTIATWSALVALYFAFSAWSQPEPGPGGVDPTPAPRSLWAFALAGFFAGFTACNELPALSFAAMLFLVLLVRRPGPTLAYFAPAVAIPIAAFLLTNYLAIGQLKPAYGEFGGAAYNYAGSHWRIEPGEAKQGIDWAWQKETTAEYGFNLLVGHHGFFSLTPVFFLGVAGTVISLAQRKMGEKPMPDGDTRSISPAGRLGELIRAAPFSSLLAVLGLVLTVTLLAFYVFVTDARTHNYGGWTSGPRQLMWLTPFLLLTALPCLDRLATSRGGRGLAYALLGISVLSVSYPAWNPWRHPWFFDFLQTLGWVQY
jgi:hypothetical protein